MASNNKFGRKNSEMKSDKDFILNDTKMVTVSLFRNNIYIHIKDRRKFKSVTFNLSDFTTLLHKLPKIKKIIASGYNYLQYKEKERGKKVTYDNTLKEDKFSDDNDEDDDDVHDEDDMPWD